jgi:hypothetical protein
MRGRGGVEWSNFNDSKKKLSSLFITVLAKKEMLQKKLYLGITNHHNCLPHDTLLAKEVDKKRFTLSVFLYFSACGT